MGQHKEIILTDGETKRLQEQQLEAITLFLDEGSKQIGVTAGYFEMLMRETVRREGMPLADEQDKRDDIVKRSVLLAETAAKWALKVRAEVTAEVVRDLKVRTIPPFVVWAARRSGVELFPTSPLVTAVADAAEKANH